ncbi:MAG: nucleotide pyrophosphohydrolase [Gammaproteobacteria bacterium]
MSELEELRQRLRAFAAERDWEQFHTPKNLAMALVAEAGEVVEHFQWLTAAESGALTPEQRAEVALELADVLLYLVMLADRLGVDLGDAAHRKIILNEKRFPRPPRP